MKIIYKQCKYCANWGTMDCPNSSKCFETIDKPYWKINLKYKSTKIQRLINRIICLFKGHDWKYSFKTYFVSEFGYYEEQKCTRCGKRKRKMYD